MSTDPISRDSSPAWQELYKSAILELDYNRVSNRIEEARRAIRDRAKLFASSANERRELNDALQNLAALESVIEREKTG
jgi:hypothetical protein